MSTTAPEGREGQGHTGYTSAQAKAEGKKVIPNGGNSAIQDHVNTSAGKGVTVGKGSNKGDPKKV